jgi:hypothetical protein
VTNVDDLSATVERVRSEHFPDLPKELVAEILVIEGRHVEDRGPAARLVDQAIETWLGEQD